MRLTPWGAVAAVALFAVGVVGCGNVQSQGNKQREAANAPFTPSTSNPDPSRQIPGVLINSCQGGQHVHPTQRVAYDHSPPFGGPHDAFWAPCNGVVYPRAVRNENMVHSLEHGAVWVTYRPDLAAEQIRALRTLAQRQTFVLVSPFPGLPAPVVASAWGRQLRLDAPADPRLAQFVRRYRAGPQAPEPGARCTGGVGTPK